MKINQLIANNISRLDVVLPEDQSLGIAGLSGSGKRHFVKRLGRVKNVSSLYYQRLNINICFQTLWKRTSVPLKWRTCLLYFSRKILNL